MQKTHTWTLKQALGPRGPIFSDFKKNLKNCLLFSNSLRHPVMRSRNPEHPVNWSRDFPKHPPPGPPNRAPPGGPPPLKVQFTGNCVYTLSRSANSVRNDFLGPFGAPRTLFWALLGLPGPPLPGPSRDPVLGTFGPHLGPPRAPLRAPQTPIFRVLSHQRGNFSSTTSGTH